MELIRTHDALFKFVFGEPEQMAELLRATLPDAVGRAIDWSALARVPGSFVDRALGERHTDLLFTARMGHATVLLYVVPEHNAESSRPTRSASRADRGGRERASGCRPGSVAPRDGSTG